MQHRGSLLTTLLCLRFVLPVLVSLESLAVPSAVGQTLWPGNGHYYLIVEQTATWQEARSRAELMPPGGRKGALELLSPGSAM